ncbi:MAG TPA: DUF5615 family PIN-like protein [Thermoanaerobaculia bacterium]|nr:DUF5615 family PIN-like protein [Thermoanaerobaculia bacterium]
MKRVLLDENLPRLFKRELTGFDVLTVVEAGWAGIKNGRLLRLAEAEFAIFVTADRNLPHQQNLTSLGLGIVVLTAGSTKLEDLRPLAPAVRDAISRTGPGQLAFVPTDP